jgi:hypothetical protein
MCKTIMVLEPHDESENGTFVMPSEKLMMNLGGLLTLILA